MCLILIGITIEKNSQRNVELVVTYVANRSTGCVSYVYIIILHCLQGLLTVVFCVHVLIIRIYVPGGTIGVVMVPDHT